MIVLDIETSGLDKVKCGIWQIGALDFYAPQNTFLEEARIDKEDTVIEDALKVTGKTIEELMDRNKQSQKQLLENFFSWCRKTKVKNCLCQNPQFDTTFLEIKARKYSLEIPFHYRAFDLHSIASVRYYQLNNKFLIKENRSDIGLFNILKLCNIPDERIQVKKGKVIKQGKPHSALEDAELTAECFSRLVYGKSLLSKYKQFQIPKELVR